MIRQHRMPFGSEVLADGAVRFRLWAPAAAPVRLCLEGCEDEDNLLELEPRDGARFGDVEMDEQVVQAGGRQLMAQRLQGHAPVACRKPDLLGGIAACDRRAPSGHGSIL